MFDSDMDSPKAKKGKGPKTIDKGLGSQKGEENVVRRVTGERGKPIPIY